MFRLRNLSSYFVSDDQHTRIIDKILRYKSHRKPVCFHLCSTHESEDTWGKSGATAGCDPLLVEKLSTIRDKPLVTQVPGEDELEEEAVFNVILV